MIQLVEKDENTPRTYVQQLKQRCDEKDSKVDAIVADILENVRNNGDKAVAEYTLKFDGSIPELVEITKEQMKELRTKVKEKISKLSRRETEESDKKILHQIKSLAEYKNADTIFCYVSTEKEINTIPLLQEILDSGKRLGVPKCTGKGIMDAYEIQNLEQLKIGSYGILEPGEECDIILDPTEIQFAIIPCISCNRKGERLGHGGGFYDRYLEKMPEDCEKAILCRESLMCDEIPTEEQDERMDLVISENGIIRIKKEVCDI